MGTPNIILNRLEVHNFRVISHAVFEPEADGAITAATDRLE